MKQTQKKHIIHTIVSIIPSIIELIIGNPCLFRIFLQLHYCRSKSKTLYVLIIEDSPNLYILKLYTSIHKMNCEILKHCKDIFFLFSIKQIGSKNISIDGQFQ